MSQCVIVVLFRDKSVYYTSLTLYYTYYTNPIHYALYTVHTQQILRAADEDGDGFIDANEIATGLAQAQTLRSRGSKWYVGWLCTNLLYYSLITYIDYVRHMYICLCTLF